MNAGYPSAATRLVALLGDPISHSLSPRIQNAAFRAAGVDGTYLALRCDGSMLPHLLRGIARAGGAGNVTVPHKEAAAAAVDRRTEVCDRTGACNTYWLQDGEVWGDNTDVAGIARALVDLLGKPLRGLHVLLLGAGGSARAALCALVDGGAEEIVLLNRSRDRAEALRARFADAGPRITVATDQERLAGERFDLAVNATSLGLSDADPLPIEPDLAPVAAGLDLVYRPGGTAWVNALRRRAIPAADGTGVLLYQGAAAFERWWSRPAPLGAMRKAVASLRSDDPSAVADSSR